MHILVSACLLGTPCRYDGASKPIPALAALERQGHTLIPVCPEVMGGLPTPRSPAERQRDGSIVNQAGQDVTAQYEAGAQAALQTCQASGCRLAILKERSPSCGNREIYDGSFTRTLIPGSGVAAQLLSETGISVIGESQIPDYFPTLEESNYDTF